MTASSPISSASAFSNAAEAATTITMKGPKQGPRQELSCRR